MDIIDYKRVKPVAIWLYFCAFSVFCMAIIGAITRLTDSGLSMVEWRPLMGALPPMDTAEWERVFNLYKETPQYKHLNEGMSLPEFKNIFVWEWVHRLLGRAIGIVYTVPFVLFVVLKRIPRVYLPSFIGFLLLGAGQGLMGWYMVKSGLVDVPSVSHYRLAAHLGLAFLLFGLLLNMALKFSVPPVPEKALMAPLHRPVRRSLILLGITIFYGVLVAGLDAGLIYNSFPMMGQYPWPGEGLDMQPLWKNFVENHAMVQFIHRLLALLTFVSIMLNISKSLNFQKSARLSRLFGIMGFVVILQVTLGILTLLTQVSLPLAVMHQGGALLLLGTLIWAMHELPPADYSFDLSDK